MAKNKDLSDEAVDVATCILIALDDYGTDPVIAQAALGNAWYRLCKGIKYPPSVFWDMLNGLGKMYEQSSE